jgi:hypothetical protein
VTGTLARLEEFIAAWRPRFGKHRDVRFAAQALDAPPGLHFALADGFVTGLGYKAIGANWELLDADGAPDAPRSAHAAFVEAFANDMVFSREPWLGPEAALALAEDFLACFEPRSRQIVTNRMYFGWNPITEATLEWAFVAFDDQAIALLLTTAED